MTSVHDVSAAVGDLSLRDYLMVVRRRKWIIVLSVLVVTATALGSAMLQTPTYQASVLVKVSFNPNQASGVLDPGSQPAVPTDPDRFMSDEAQVASSPQTTNVVVQKFGVAYGIAVTPVANSYLLRFTATSDQPINAQLMANAYAAAYNIVSRNQNQAVYAGGILSLALKIKGLQTQVASLRSQQGSDPKTQAYQTLQDTINGYLGQASNYQNQLDSLSRAQATVQSSGSIVALAGKPSTPVAPKPLNSAIVGATAGLALGLTAAFILERLDDSVKSNHDIEAVSDGLPTLGIIPFETVPRQEPLYVAARDHTNSPGAEAYRSLRTSVRLLCLDQSLRVLQVTSPSQGEGKSTTIANLGVALAQAGVRTTIVCSDFRRPKLHTYFGLSNEIGFSSALVGDVPLSEAVQAVPGQENLYLLASGPRPGNPSELLSGRRVQKIFEALRLASDVVLVDAPPVLPVTDASIIGRMVDGTLVVARAGVTSSKDLRRTLDVLRQVKVPLVGLVLNGTGRATSYGYTGGYGYGVRVRVRLHRLEPGPTSTPTRRSRWSPSPPPTGRRRTVRPRPVPPRRQRPNPRADAASSASRGSVKPRGDP